MDMSYFDYWHGLTMTERRSTAVRRPAAEPGAPIDQRDMDLAASIQVVTEEIVLRMARHIHKRPARRTFAWPAAWR